MVAQETARLTHPLSQASLCSIDCSFGAPNTGGVGYWLTNNQVLQQYGLCPIQASTPFQTEAAALLMAIRAAEALGITTYAFLRDSQILAQTFSSLATFN